LNGADNLVVKKNRTDLVSLWYGMQLEIYLFRVKVRTWSLFICLI